MKILFISHDASRTGAPMVFLHLLNWLKANTEIEIFILLQRGGNLVGEFSKVSETKVWFRSTKKRKLSFKDEIKRSVKNWLVDEKSHQNSIKKWVDSNKIDLIYSNSAASSEVLVALDPKVPVIQHIHELETTINTYCSPENFKQTHQFTSKYVAVSEIVKNNLILNHNVDDNNLRIINEFVPEPIVHISASEMKKQLGFDENTLIVGGSGTLCWRKGTDLFLQVAKKTPDTINGRPVKFLWIGGKLNAQAHQEYLHDIKHLGLENKVVITGLVTNPGDYFNVLDLFLMTSREDPFPLVCIEAGYLKKPVICFEGVVGSTDFVTEETGGVVPYADIDHMAEKTQSILDNEHLRFQKGNSIFTHVSRDYNLDKLAQKCLNLIQEVII